MIETNCIFFFKDNLLPQYAHLPIEDVIYEHFNSVDMGGIRQKIISQAAVLYVGDNGQTKLLKNRYGNSGVVTPQK